MAEQKKILDLGCGTGLTTFYLAVRGDVVGLDLDVSRAQRDFSELKFVQGSAEYLPFKNEQFDEIYCYDVLEHVDDLQKTLLEISRTLKKNGKLIADVPFWKSEKFLLRVRPKYHEEIHHQRIFAYEELEQRMKELGFEMISRKKLRGIDNLKLYLLFRENSEIINQQGELSNPNSFFLESLYLLFKRDLFKTKLKYFVPVWIFTLPVGLVINLIFPKTISFIFRKK